MTKPAKLLYVVASPMTATAFLLPHLRYLVQHGEFEATVVCSPGPQLVQFADEQRISVIPVPIERGITPLKDLISLWRLIRVMRQVRPVLVNVGTPKGGLLGGIAAWLAMVPCRVYTVHGLRLETTAGLRRSLLSLSEKAVCACVHNVLCVSPSLRRRLLDLRLCSPERVWCTQPGSWAGVPSDHFGPSQCNLRRAAGFQKKLGLEAEARVVGFAGRLTRDKGIPELVTAFRKVRAAIPDLRLLLVGDFDDSDPVPAEARRAIMEDPGIIRTGFVEDSAPYYHLMTVLAFPSYREGFPNVPLEASAAGVPVVATRVTGAVDAVIDGATGLLVPVGDAEALAQAIETLLKDRELARRLATVAKERVVREFQPERIWNQLRDLYRRMLACPPLMAPGVICPRAKLRLGREAEEPVPDFSGEALRLTLPGRR